MAGDGEESLKRVILETESAIEVRVGVCKQSRKSSGEAIRENSLRR